MPGISAYGTILSNVTNLKKAFAPEAIDIEVVCHGAGIDMLFMSQSSLASQMKRVHNLGVVFAACGNTLRGKKIDRNRIYPYAKVVDSGVAEVVRKQEAGWSYLKGAF